MRDRGPRAFHRIQQVQPSAWRRLARALTAWTRPALRRVTRWPTWFARVVTLALVAAGGGIVEPLALGEALPAAALPVVASAEETVAATPGNPVLGPGGVFVPATVDASRPVPVLLALHGMGGSGARIAQRLAPCAERNGWVLVAPTLAYRDYMDPEQVRLDEQQDLPRLREIIESLPGRLGSLRLDERILVYGFSRGGQVAQRLALFYPQQVAGVAVLAAGSYTLPAATVRVGHEETPLKFPFGVADLADYAGRPFDPRSLAGLPFWIGVGAADTAVSQVPPSWSPYLGSTRRARAWRVAELLRGVGADVTLNVFAGVGHEETGLMRARACAFLAAQAPLHDRPAASRFLR